ncbi:hypothetical protein EM595_0018 [Duffyella gerundensis]|uniref:Uncharacterized protein n=1 Tax=Duffyella gerundensis TaxID=1619313 RepID=A0A0U5KXZ6_9GAMM|nr:hypothetical protein EM595_0018 [Duffyella gerundensis]
MKDIITSISKLIQLQGESRLRYLLFNNPEQAEN